jgi:hypothetical protein
MILSPPMRRLSVAGYRSPDLPVIDDRIRSRILRLIHVVRREHGGADFVAQRADVLQMALR